MNDLVSIIIPVYNAEKYLKRTVESALNQQYQPIEIILIDDGSTDHSFEIAKQFESPRVKVIQQKNSGASIARNTGLKSAKGKYIQFLDADDFLSTNKIEDQVKALAEKPGYVALGPTVHFFNENELYILPIVHDWYREGSDDPVDFLIKLYGGDQIGKDFGGMVQPNAWLTPRSIIDKAGQWEEMRNPDDDGEFFCRVLLKSKGVVYCEDAVNYYRKFQNSNQSLSSFRDYNSCKNILRSTQLKTKNLLSQTDRSDAKLAMAYQLWHNGFSFFPKYKDLSEKAFRQAFELYPNLNIKPFTSGIKAFLSGIFGWKMVKMLMYLKHKKN